MPIKKNKHLINFLKLSAVSTLSLTTVSCYNLTRVDDSKKDTKVDDSNNDTKVDDSKKDTKVENKQLEVSSYIKNIFEKNNNEIDDVDFSKYKELEKYNDIVQFINPDTSISELSINNLFLNNFTLKNIAINVKNLNKHLNEIGVKYTDKFQLVINYTQINRDLNDLDTLVIPATLRRYIDIVDDINEFQQIPLTFKIKGLTTNETFKNLKDHLNSIINKNGAGFNNENPNEYNNENLNVTFEENLDKTDLLYASKAKLNKLIKIKFKNTEDSIYYDSLTKDQKNENVPKNSKNEYPNYLNTRVISFEFNPNDPTKYILKFRASYGNSSKNLKSAPIDFIDFVKSYGINLVYNGSFSEDSYSKIYKLFAEKMLNINILGSLNKDNYNFSQAALGDFSLYSKSSLLTYKIENLEKFDDKVKLTIKTESENENLNNLVFDATFGLKSKGFIFDSELQNSKNKFNSILNDLDQHFLNKISTNLFDKANGSEILPGGYDEIRGFYADSHSARQIHLGEDILVRENTILHSPFDAEIISLLYSKNEKPFSGIGGQLVLKVNKDDLKNTIDKNVFENYFEDADYIYLGIIHLNFSKTISLLKLNENIFETSKFARANATFTNPIRINKNDPIAVVGGFNDNGG
ncbi:UNVERIFIED_CONTAM: hypothetical protein O8I53_09415 [Campylobacter lari]